MSSTRSVAALVSAGRNPLSGAPRASRGDAAAMALGRTLAGEALRVLHAGDAEEPSLRDYMAYGAGKIEILPAAAGGDAISALVGALADVDIVLTGTKAEQGAGSGLLPYVLAEALGRPVVANALEIRVEDGEARIRQFMPKGQRRNIACPLPIVIAVHPLAPVDLRYAFARRVSGRVETMASARLDTEMVLPSWAVEAGPRRAVRLKAEDQKSGHARLLSAIVSEVKGGVVAFEGTTVDKAQVVLNYLREHRLIDF